MVKKKSIVFFISIFFLFFTFALTAKADDTSGWYCDRSSNPLGVCTQCTTANPQPGGTCWAADVNACRGAGCETQALPNRAKCVNFACVSCASNDTSCPFNAIPTCQASGCETKYSCGGIGVGCKPDPAGTQTLSDCQSSCQVINSPGTALNFAGACSPAGGKAGEGIQTAIGCIPIGSGTAITTFVINWGIGIAGGIAILLIVYAGFLIMTSQGDPKRLQGGQELMTSAIAGVILIIFSIFILRVLGVTVLGLF